MAVLNQGASGLGSCVTTSAPGFVLAVWEGDKRLASVLTERWAKTAVAGESSPFQSDAHRYIKNVEIYRYIYISIYTPLKYPKRETGGH